MNIGIFMNAWISYLSILWTHEFHFWKIHEPMNMNTNIAMNSWIWISNFSWTHEYEYGHVTPWTFKSSYSSWNFMNHAMNSMNCNAWTIKILCVFGLGFTCEKYTIYYVSSLCQNCHFVNIKISTTDIVIGQIQILKKLKRCYLIRLPKERLDWKWYVCDIEYEEK